MSPSIASCPFSLALRPLPQAEGSPLDASSFGNPFMFPTDETALYRESLPDGTDTSPAESQLAQAAAPAELVPALSGEPVSDEPDPDLPMLLRPESVLLILLASLLVFWELYQDWLDAIDPVDIDPLTSSQLADRLGVTSRTIRRRKRMANFGNWTQQRDPEGIAWRYQGGIYLPASYFETQL